MVKRNEDVHDDKWQSDSYVFLVWYNTNLVARLNWTYKSDVKCIINWFDCYLTVNNKSTLIILQQKPRKIDKKNYKIKMC